MAEPYPSSFNRQSVLWLLQRVTAALLIVLLAFHFFLLHFVEHAWEIDFAATQTRMQNTLYFATMVLFLVTAAFHGVNGVYNALINQGIEGRQRRVLKWLLLIAGISLIIQGIRVALAMAGVSLL